MAQLHPLALGSLFVASYDSQGYGGGIVTRLYPGWTLVSGNWSPLYSVSTDRRENTAFNSSSVVAC
jgi:hypothetical protein